MNNQESRSEATRALILVDIQNDFVPGGALPTKRGDEVVPVVNALQPHFELVIATQDWHPPDHGSFASNHPGREPGEIIDLDGIEQVLWPDHCVQESPGAEFHPDLQMEKVAKVIRKGTDPGIDSYSGFFDNGHRKATGLGDYLTDRGVSEVVIVGLATDYCVKFTALDAVRLGFRASVVRDACRGVELQPGDIERAFTEMEAAGVRVVTSENVHRS
jgi:nicotinamidase/pyrazinamidase